MHVDEVNSHNTSGSYPSPHINFFVSDMPSQVSIPVISNTETPVLAQTAPHPTQKLLVVACPGLQIHRHYFHKGLQEGRNGDEFDSLSPIGPAQGPSVRWRAPEVDETS